MNSKQTPIAAEPMATLLNRQSAYVADYERRMAAGLPAYVAPTWKPQDHARQMRAARAYGALHVSDPFAYARMRMHLRRGLEAADEVYRDANVALAAKAARKLERTS